MKAIETRYRDFRFRSRLEARYAVFFDALQVEWLYEYEGYELDEDRYLPDFWLPKLKIFVEIKGEFPNDREVRLCRKLQWYTDRMVLLCYGLPNENNGWLLAWDHVQNIPIETWADWANLVDTDRLPFAVIRAKEARFEYGENGRSQRNTVNYDRIGF